MTSKRIEHVPMIGQYPVLPTGCEATALTMLLQACGLGVAKEDVARALIKEPLPYEQAGTKFGGHPNRGFIGDPFSSESYGVFHQPIAAALDHYLPGRALDITGCEWDELYRVIDSGRPLVVWATIELKEPRVVTSWQVSTGGDEVIEWQSPEHCMTMVGYTEDAVIINDPHTGQTEHYDRELFRTRWEQLGRQAVTVTPGITLREITAQNWHTCIELTTADDQSSFVTSNLYSIAESKFVPSMQVKAIYQEETMVGLVMYGIDPDDDTHWVWRLMVDRAHQRQGYARQAMELVLRDLRTRPDCQQVTIGYKPHNTAAQRLYASLGFQEQGLAPWGEMLARFLF